MEISAGQTFSPQVARFFRRSLPPARPDGTFLFPDLYPSEIKKTEINWVIGMVLGAFSYGALFTLGLNCLKLLRSLPPQAGFLNQRRLLMIHVSLQIILNGVFQINTLRQNVVAIFYTRPEDLTYFYLDKWNLLIVLVFALTDGLLVWRCYMVQWALVQPKEKRVLWHYLSWVFPLALWFVLVGVGGFSVMTGKPDVLLSEPPDVYSISLLFTCILGSILLNVYATSYIIIRLLIHRRLAIASFGHTSSLPRLHLRVISILLESAIINLPFAVTALVSALLVGGWAHLFSQITVPAQSFSSVLVIYQVSKGKAVGSGSLATKNTQSQHLDTVAESVYSP